MAVSVFLAGCVAVGDSNLLADLQLQRTQKGLALAQVYGTELTVVFFQGEARSRFLNSSIYLYGAAFHPSGEWFIGPSDQGLVAMDLKGQVLWKVERVRSASNLEWSTDGSKLAFQGKDLQDGFTGVQILDVASKALAQVSTQGQEPTWGSAADRLAYAEQGKIVIYDLASRTATSIRDGTSPAWSPDGKAMAYRGMDGHFYVAGIAEENGRPIVDGKSVLTRLSWSPDSKLVSFVKRGSRRVLDLGLDCPEPKQVMIHRLSDGTEAPVHQLCKSAPFEFRWIRNKTL